MLTDCNQALNWGNLTISLIKKQYTYLYYYTHSFPTSLEFGKLVSSLSFFPPVHETRLKDRVSPQAYFLDHCLQQILMHLNAHAIWSSPDLAWFPLFLFPPSVPLTARFFSSSHFYYGRKGKQLGFSWQQLSLNHQEKKTTSPWEVIIFDLFNPLSIIN